MNQGFSNPADVLAWVEPLLESAQTKLMAAEAKAQLKDQEGCRLLQEKNALEQNFDAQSLKIEQQGLQIRELEAEVSALREAKLHEQDWDSLEREMRGLADELNETRASLQDAESAKIQEFENREEAERELQEAKGLLDTRAHVRSGESESLSLKELIECHMAAVEEQAAMRLGEVVLQNAQASKLEEPTIIRMNEIKLRRS